MFQILNEESVHPEDRKLATLRAGIFLAALLALGVAVYFFAFLPYANG